MRRELRDPDIAADREPGPLCGWLPTSHGDGAHSQELATAAQYGARVIVLIANNGLYGTIRMHQDRRFPGRVSGTELVGPDFVALAKSFGAHAERVETTDAFAPAFERACAANRSAVLELVTDPNQITPERRLSA